MMQTNVPTAVLYDGSITDYDSRLYGFDIGTCLEVTDLTSWTFLLYSYLVSVHKVSLLNMTLSINFLDHTVRGCC